MFKCQKCSFEFPIPMCMFSEVDAWEFACGKCDRSIFISHSNAGRILTEEEFKQWLLNHKFPKRGGSSYAKYRDTIKTLLKGVCEEKIKLLVLSGILPGSKTEII